jgi:hypothetical protein
MTTCGGDFLVMKSFPFFNRLGSAHLPEKAEAAHAIAHVETVRRWRTLSLTLRPCAVAAFGLELSSLG